MQISLDVTNAPDVTAELRRIGDQAPFAMSLALNDTANAAQSAIRLGLSASFKLRRPDFILKTIYRAKATDFATKRSLQSTVRVNPERDVLAKFEDGGRKGPLVGQHVAVPLPAVRRNKSDIIPRSQRPSGLLGKAGVEKITTKNGTFLVQHKGRSKGKGARTDFLYKLVPDVPIRPQLLFGQNATKAIDDAFVRLALSAIDRALITAR